LILFDKMKMFSFGHLESNPYKSRSYIICYFYTQGGGTIKDVGFEKIHMLAPKLVRPVIVEDLGIKLSPRC
jgi:hypothetical protein